MPAAPVHSIEPELRGPTPRQVREASALPRLQRRLTRLAVFVFCIVCWYVSYRLRDANDWLRYQREVSGKVVSGRYSRDNDDQAASYYLLCSFQSPQGNVNGETTVTESVFDRLRAGDMITLFYRADDPKRWQIAPESPDSVRALQDELYGETAFVALSLIVGSGILWKYRMNRMRLLREGMPAVATVVKWRAPTPDLSAFPTLTYEWRTHGGQPRHKTIVVANDLANLHARHPAGTQFTALCDPRDTHNSVPYFLATEGEIKGKYDAPQLPVIP